MSKFWDFVVKKPVSALLSLGLLNTHRVSIHPEDLAAAHATQHGQSHHYDLPDGQGVVQTMPSNDDHHETAASRGGSGDIGGRMAGCKKLAKKIAIGISILIALVICGLIALATARVGPEVLWFALCCLSCVGALAALGVGYVWFKRKFGHMIPSGSDDH